MAKLELPGLMQVTEFIRIWFMKIAVLLSNYLPFESNKIFLFLILLLAVILSTQIIRILPMRRYGWVWVILVAIFFSLIRYY